MAEFGAKNWAFVADELSKRTGVSKTGKQCRERWHNQLDPSIKKTPVTEEEERVICEGFREVENHWAEISERLN